MFATAEGAPPFLKSPSSIWPLEDLQVKMLEQRLTEAERVTTTVLTDDLTSVGMGPKYFQAVPSICTSCLRKESKTSGITKSIIQEMAFHVVLKPAPAVLFLLLQTFKPIMYLLEPLPSETAGEINITSVP